MEFCPVLVASPFRRSLFLMGLVFAFTGGILAQDCANVEFSPGLGNNREGRPPIPNIDPATALTWNPSSCRGALQGYLEGKVAFEQPSAQSGSVTAGQACQGKTGMPCELKLWTAASPVVRWIQLAPPASDCRSAQLIGLGDVSTGEAGAPTVWPDVLLKWEPTTCSADLVVYQSGRPIGRVQNVRSGTQRLSDVAPGMVLEQAIEIQLFTGDAVPASKRWVVPSRQPRFDFSTDPQFTLHEQTLGVAACYAEGLAEIGLSSEFAVSPRTSFLLWTNKAQGSRCNHVIAHKRVFDSCITGAWDLSLQVRMDPATFRNAGTGPEASFVNICKDQAGRFYIQTAAFQYLPATGKWQLWMPAGPNQAEWKPIEGPPLKSGVFYRIILSADVTTQKYLAIYVSGPDGQQQIPLSQFSVPTENKFEQVGVEITLEGEPACNCSLPRPSPGDFKLWYDDVTLSPHVSVLNGASFEPKIASGSFVSIFGQGLANHNQSAGQPLPTSIQGTSVNIEDATGAQNSCLLVAISPSQINCVMPKAVKPGWTDVLIKNGPLVSGSATVQIHQVAPGLFSANGDGRGIAAGLACRVVAGALSCNLLAVCGAAYGSCVGVPVDVSTGDVYLSLFGTGITAGSDVRATVGGVPVSALAAATVQYPGLDQVNLGPMPSSLAGKGEMPIILTVDEKAANTVAVLLK